MLIVNLFQIKSGGGLQNALSFLSSNALRNHGNYMAVCLKGGKVEEFCRGSSIPHGAIPGGGLFLVYFHFLFFLYLRLRYRVSVVFSIFGPPPIFKYGAYAVSGFAYSNILQPEIDFWGFLPLRKRVIKQVKDRLRLWMCRRADEIIVETDYLKERASSGVFKDKKVHVVNMEPSLLLGKNRTPDESICAVEGIKVLYLAGAHPNKRIHLLSDVFKSLSKFGSYVLVTTLPDDSSYFQDIKSRFDCLGISNCLINVGPVDPAAIAGLIGACDSMINVALLESFSNNWVEAWSFSKPLITTDAEWARASCRDAAIYVNPSDADSSALVIHKALSNPDVIRMAIENGKKNLSYLSRLGDKSSRYMSIVFSAPLMKIRK